MSKDRARCRPREQPQVTSSCKRRRFLLYPLLHERHGDARHPAAEGLKTEEQGAIERTEKARDALHIEDVRELIHRPRRRFRAERLIRHLHERRHIARRLQHAIQLRLLATLGRGLHLRGALLQRPREGDRTVDEGGIKKDAHSPRV